MPPDEPRLSVADMAAVTIKLAEVALATVASNGGGGVPSPEVRHVLGRLALAAPETAIRCRHVRAALGPDVFALVSALRATPAPTQPPDPADSDAVLTAGEAAHELGVSPQAVRGAAKRGSLPGRLGPDGRWHFRQVDIDRRRHGKGQ